MGGAVPAPSTASASDAGAVAQPAGYGDFLFEIKAQIRQRQTQALRAANRELLALYWWLGENISRRQSELGWGKGVVETTARDLQAEFPGRNGFSAQNLWAMRQLFREYEAKPKPQTLIGEISWAKNLLILARCKDDLEREFYLRATARFGWTTKVLQHQLDNQSYAQYLSGQTNFDAALPDTIKAQARLAVKDHYTFDFLGLADELKIGEFKPEHKGQIEFYLDTLDQQHRIEGENPPIGIVICRSKTRTVVEYALRNMTRPLGIATYTVTPRLPASYRGELPSAEEIAKRLEGWGEVGGEGAGA